MAVKFFLRNSPDTIKAAVDLSREDFIEKYSNTTAGREILFKAWDEIRAKHLPKDQTKQVQFKVIATDKKVVPISTTVKEKANKISEQLNKTYDKAYEMNVNPPMPDKLSGFIKKEEVEYLPELSHEEVQEEMMMEAANLADRSRYGGGMLAEGELPEGSIIGKVESIAAEQIGEGIQISDELEIVGSGKTVLDPVKVRKSNRGRRRLKNADQRDARILELLKLEMKGQDILKKMKEEGFSVHAPQITYIKQANNL